MPTVSLGTHRFADTDGDGVFNTAKLKKGSPRSYTLEDTLGCSCEQIIAECGYGEGHTKYGCSISVMDAWVAGGCH